MNLADLQKNQPQTEKKVWVSPVLVEEVISATNSGRYNTFQNIENIFYHS